MQLAEFPELESWHERSGGLSPDSDPCEVFLARLCTALEQPDVKQPEAWLQTLRYVADLPQEEAPAVFEDIEDALHAMSVDLNQVMAELSEQAFLSGRGAALQDVAVEAFSLTQSSTLHFIAAWAAFNNDQLELCIKLCTSFQSDFADVYILHGQALLEASQPDQAIATLLKAVHLNGAEPLAWFQLARGYMALDRFEEAWNALERCDGVRPDHPEIALLMLYVLEQADEINQSRADMVLSRLRKQLGRVKFAPIVLIQIIELQLKVEGVDEPSLQTLLAEPQYASPEAQPELLPHLGGWLKELHRRGWHAAARDLLLRLTPST